MILLKKKILSFCWNKDSQSLNIISKRHTLSQRRHFDAYARVNTLTLLISDDSEALLKVVL